MILAYATISKTLRISQWYHKYTKVFPKNKIKNKSYTLRLFYLWVGSFYRICFWKASGSREPLAPTIFTFLPKPLLCQRWGLYSLVFIYSCKNYDCSRGVAESSARCMMCLPSCCATYGLVLLLFLWASSQSPITQVHSCGVGNHIHPSCSAQTLRRVSSLDKELRSRNNFKQNLLLEYIWEFRGCNECKVTTPQTLNSLNSLKKTTTLPSWLGR